MSRTAGGIRNQRRMRFNCQNCSAKYRIADDKVAGKLLRMKCRKCDTTIVVRALPGGEAEHVIEASSDGHAGVTEAHHVEPVPTITEGSVAEVLPLADLARMAQAASAASVIEVPAGIGLSEPMELEPPTLRKPPTSSSEGAWPASPESEPLILTRIDSDLPVPPGLEPMRGESKVQGDPLFGLGEPSSSVVTSAPALPSAFDGSAPTPPPLPATPAPSSVEGSRAFDVSEADFFSTVAAEPTAASHDGVERRARGRRIHPFAWGLIAMCGGLGAIAAGVILSQSSSNEPEVAPTPKIASLRDADLAATPSATNRTAAAASPDEPASAEDKASDAAAPSANGDAVPSSGAAGVNVARVDGGATPSGRKNEASGASGSACDPRTDPFCRSVGGPDVDGGPSAGADTGPGLTQEQLSAVVSRNSGSVQRACLPLVQGAQKVTVRITVGSTGNVSNVSTSGGSGPVVSCIKSRVSGWRFPASSGSTQVVVPFQLISQQ